MTKELDPWVAAETVLSDVDGAAGRLIIKGFDLEVLAGHRSYEEVVQLLWQDVVDHDAGDAQTLRQRLGQARGAAFRRLMPLLAHRKDTTTSDLMRFLLAAPDAAPGDALAELANTAVAAALSSRHVRGAKLIEPDVQAGHAEDLLRMISGRDPKPEESAALDTYLVTAIDHGLNASTFTARVVASTDAGLRSALVAAFAALTGPLHGGAPGPVLDMLDAIGSPANAGSWIDQELAGGRRLMGFGHRIYRVRDPRADVLKTALQRLDPQSGRIALAEAIERIALDALNARGRSRRLDTNTEFYTALLLEALAIPRESFTPVFAAARCAGWIAHVSEQKAAGRLIRPLSRYVGDQPKKAA